MKCHCAGLHSFLTKCFSFHLQEKKNNTFLMANPVFSLWDMDSDHFNFAAHVTSSAAAGIRLLLPF